jgi:putative membrane-bound dehydrogenase-like protein
LFNAAKEFNLSMKVLASVAVAVIAVVHIAAAADDFPRVPPTEPDRVEATFEVLHGFRMELIAAEPLVASPVDVAYDEDGRAYVVEMRDYPYPEEKGAEPKEFLGTVRLLEDSDGDGRFDKATIFADQLAWPTSACCWKGGVFVAAAPDIWYFKDTDGDWRADVRRKVFTGFGRYNVQAIMNNLRWGLDNKIYGAAAGNGGSIRHAERPEDKPISLARRDFCFDPVSEKIEAISGGERFGNTFDDWGNRFVCNIRNPVQHVVLEQRYLARNPHFVAPNPIHDCAESGDQLRVFRLSPPEPWRVFRAQRWALEGQAMPRSELIGAGYWTSSSGVTVYRGGAYPPQFRGNVFIGEVAGNLVHRQILERDGVTFKSRRADDNTEFVRSRDNWFRPVNFVNAPDGTLQVVDMYRETIEHPWSIPDDIKAKLDLTSGKERGRIYRLAPPGFSRPRPPKLSAATTAELVAHLESPHSWYRETAQRLLVERQDMSAVEPLRNLATGHKSEVGHVHSLYALQGLDSLTYGDVRPILFGRGAETTKHGILLAEEFYNDRADVRNEIGALRKHEDVQVRFQVALTLGGFWVNPAVSQGWLAEIADQDAADSWMRTAVLCSAAPPIPWGGLFGESTADKRQGSLVLARQVAALRARSPGRRDDAFDLIKFIADDSRLPAVPDDAAFAILSGLGEGLRSRKVTLASKFEGQPWADKVRKRLAAAETAAGDGTRPVAERLVALELVATAPWSDARPKLFAALDSAEPVAVQRAALKLIGSFDQLLVADELIAHWQRLTPPLRDEAVGVLLSRRFWDTALVEALEKGTIPPAQVSIPHRARLASLADKGLAERAKAALAAVALSPRKQIIENYQPVLALKGDAERGQVVYRRECASCHRLRGEGHDVGPSLETIQHRSPQEILIHVLDPSREVSPQFLDYSVRLTDGRVLTGMIASETDTGLILRRADNREDAVVRSEIEDISSSGKSLMPEGLEQKISREDMADLIRFLKLAP